MIPRKKALILAPDKPEIITELIPSATGFVYKGHNLLAVKHNLDTVRVLRNLGLNAPSPLLYDGFEFTGRFTPVDTQVATAEFLTLYTRAYVFNKMRTGKTASALWTYDYLHKRGYVNKALVVCPLDVIDVWTKEAFRTVPQYTILELLGSKEKRIKLLNAATELVVTNFDGLVTLREEILEWNPDLIIADEASAYCNPNTKRYKALKHQFMKRPDRRLWLLTGTPTPNAPTDAYGLIKLINPSIIPNNFKLFKETHMMQVGPYKWVPKIGAKDAVFQLMQPAVRYTRKETGLPTTTEPVLCTMSPKQQAVFDDIKAKMRYESEVLEVSAANAAVKLIKLQQVMCGAVKDDDGNILYLDPTDRLEKLEYLIEQADAKVIVFVPFKASMYMIQNHLEKRWRTIVINGDISKSERKKGFAAFCNLKDPHVLIAHPKITAYGLDLSVADTNIWYAPTFSTEQYEQANYRIEGPNKHEQCGIYQLYCHPVEKRIYDVLTNKISMQSELLGLYDAMLSEA